MACDSVRSQAGDTSCTSWGQAIFSACQEPLPRYRPRISASFSAVAAALSIISRTAASRERARRMPALARMCAAEAAVDGMRFNGRSGRDFRFQISDFRGGKQRSHSKDEIRLGAERLGRENRRVLPLPPEIRNLKSGPRTWQITWPSCLRQTRRTVARRQWTASTLMDGVDWISDFRFQGRETAFASKGWN